MVELRVRNMNEDVVGMLRERAEREGRTLSSLVGDVLAAEAMRPRHEWSARLERLREGIRARCGELPDSTPDIREERDRWG